MKLLQACLLTIAMGMASIELEAGEMDRRVTQLEN